MCAAQPKKSPSLYAVHPGVIRDHGAEVDLRLKRKTGRALDEWMALPKQEAPPDEKDRRQWLKISHKLGSKNGCTLPTTWTANSWGALQSSSPMRIAAPKTVVHRPRLSPTADWVMFMVRTILLEIR